MHTLKMYSVLTGETKYVKYKGKFTMRHVALRKCMLILTGAT